MQESSDEAQDTGDASSSQRCLNCDTPLSGQYCSQCGQRSRSRLISVWELVRDAFGDLFELDSRLWQTVIPLLFRPGRLTRDYLRGRRARFMPPFRTYLVLSVVFFLVAFFDPQRQFGMLLAPQAVPADEQTARDVDIRQDVMDELAAEGIIVGDGRSERATPDGEDDIGVISGIDAQTPEGIGDCNFQDADFDDFPEWLSKRLTPERLNAVCENIRADSGREFLDRLLENVPASLFILLPLMALVLKILYPLSKRYYVEHLLFILHYHAFVFLALTLEVLWSRLASLIRLPEFFSDLTAFVISIYIPVYLYKSLRRVYEQGRAITLLKFLLLMVAYLLGFGFILLMATFYTAFSI